eukprot:1416016-Pleurochrysis_carterae.AAC.4
MNLSYLFCFPYVHEGNVAVKCDALVIVATSRAVLCASLNTASYHADRPDHLEREDTVYIVHTECEKTLYELDLDSNAWTQAGSFALALCAGRDAHAHART